MPGAKYAATQKRRAHNKSRRGCRNCKQRHIKCDELGPPCANCVARKVGDSCEYSPRPSPTPRPVPSASQTSSTTITVFAPTPSTAKSLSLPYRSYHDSPLPSQTGPASPAEVFFSNSIYRDYSLVLSPLPPPLDADSRLLELELMNRWTSRTWTILYMIPACQSYLQEYIPRSALRNSWLMNGMLAMAAADLAISTSLSREDLGTSIISGQSARRYLGVALKYGGQAAAEFRTQVLEVTPGNIDLLLYFTTMMALLGFATPVDDTTIVQRVAAYFDMTLRSGNMIAGYGPWLMESIVAESLVTALKMYEVRPEILDRLDGETAAALDLLVSVSQSVRIGPSGTVPASDTNADDRNDEGIDQVQHPLVCDIPQYKAVLVQLRYSFAVAEVLNKVRCYWGTIIPLGGTIFASALQNLEPMALFTIVYLGILLDRNSRDPMMWVIGSGGRELVREASELVAASTIAGVEGVAEGLAWARRQVGLSEMYLMPPLQA